jgi:hypothetical protein
MGILGSSILNENILAWSGSKGMKPELNPFCCVTVLSCPRGVAKVRSGVQLARRDVDWHAHGLAKVLWVTVCETGETETSFSEIERTHVVSTAEHEADNVVFSCKDLLRVKCLNNNRSDRSWAFATRKLTRPITPSLLAPTLMVMVAAETREEAKAAMMATEEAAENFMVLNVNELARYGRN